MAQNYRVLEVKMKSANLCTETKAKRYAILSIRPNLELQTKTVCCRSNTVWNEKFVFLVPQSFLDDDNASVTVKLYRKRRLFNDSLIGKAVCSLGLLVEQETETGSESKTGTEKECVYDDSDKEGLFLNFYDNLFYDNGDTRKKEAEKKVPPMKGSAKVKVVNGLEVKGKLDMEMAVWEGDISVVGGSQDFAMRYDEFMGQQGNFSVRMKKSWMCIAPLKNDNNQEWI